MTEIGTEKRRRWTRWPAEAGVSEWVSAGATALAVLAVLHIYLLAYGDTTLAVGIFSNINYINVVTGLLFGSIPVLAAAGVFAYWAYVVNSRDFNEAGNTSSHVILGMATLFLLLWMAWPFALGFAVLLILYQLFYHLGLRDQLPALIENQGVKNRKKTLRQLSSLLFVLVSIPGLMGQLYTSKTWVPVEKLSVDNGETIGYVLRADEIWHVILEDDPRRLKFIATDDVVRREPCRTLTLPSLAILGTDQWRPYRGGPDCGN